jgi:hypothetical protein
MVGFAAPRWLAAAVEGNTAAWPPGCLRDGVLSHDESLTSAVPSDVLRADARPPTKAGFRVLATDLILDPTSARARDLLSAFGADPRFIRLCGVQQGFRARLTPKPWRCGLRLPPGQHPREDAESRARFGEWLHGYEEASSRCATCRYLETIGRDHRPDAARAIVEEHDRASRADADLPLA